MILATYIDGDEETLYGELLENHSPSVVVKVKKADEQKFIDLLQSRLGEQIVIAHDRDKPVPITLSTDELADMLDDCTKNGRGQFGTVAYYIRPDDLDPDYDWMRPYIDDLDYMALKDESGMGTVYVVKRA